MRSVGTRHASAMSFRPVILRTRAPSRLRPNTSRPECSGAVGLHKVLDGAPEGRHRPERSVLAAPPPRAGIDLAPPFKPVGPRAGLLIEPHGQQRGAAN